MYVTALLMLLLFAGAIATHKTKSDNLIPFDQKATMPLRGLLALLIVAHHLGQRTGIPVVSDFTRYIGMQIVAVFFFLSGYGLCVSYSAKRQAYMHGFLRKRFSKLLPPFVLLTAAMALALHFCGLTDLSTQLHELATKGVTPLPYSWFIYTIIYVYVAFYVCASSGASPKAVGATFLITMVLYVFVTAHLLRFPDYWWQTALAVNLGYFVALYEQKLTDIISRHRLLSYMGTTAMLFISFCVVCKVYVFNSVWLTTWILMQALSVYLIIRALGFMQWKWLCFLGAFSLDLYLVHGIPLKLGLYAGLNDYALWAFTYLAAIPAAYALHRLCSSRIFSRRLING